jgi:UDP-GlcNAc:undecaprenyl-phosphate/decaprenyl-phosphate GlcNAc-1-phosphate transferase
MNSTLLVTLMALLSAVVTMAVILRGSRLRPPRALNYRGERLLVILGIAVTAGVVAASLGALAADFREGAPLPTIRGTLQATVAIVMVFVAGLFDDAQPHRVRGLVAHARALGRGRLTSGLVKLAALLAAATLFIEATRGLTLGRVVGILFIAGSANLWNSLDVAPGRAIKYFLLAGVALQAAMAALTPCATCGFSVFVIAALAAAAVALPFDLGERAMLGDGGANVLGFIIGAGLYLRLSTNWLWAALVVVVALTLVAETLTLSRVIRAVPPLRWFDRLGRLDQPLGRARAENPPAIAR